MNLPISRTIPGPPPVLFAQVELGASGAAAGTGCISLTAALTALGNFLGIGATLMLGGSEPVKDPKKSLLTQAQNGGYTLKQVFDSLRSVERESRQATFMSPQQREDLTDALAAVDRVHAKVQAEIKAGHFDVATRYVSTLFKDLGLAPPANSTLQSFASKLVRPSRAGNPVLASGLATVNAFAPILSPQLQRVGKGLQSRLPSSISTPRPLQAESRSKDGIEISIAAKAGEAVRRTFAKPLGVYEARLDKLDRDSATLARQARLPLAVVTAALAEAHVDLRAAHNAVERLAWLQGAGAVFKARPDLSTIKASGRDGHTFDRAALDAAIELANGDLANAADRFVKKIDRLEESPGARSITALPPVESPAALSPSGRPLVLPRSPEAPTQGPGPSEVVPPIENSNIPDLGPTYTRFPGNSQRSESPITPGELAVTGGQLLTQPVPQPGAALSPLLGAPAATLQAQAASQRVVEAIKDLLRRQGAPATSQEALRLVGQALREAGQRPGQTVDGLLKDLGVPLGLDRFMAEEQQGDEKTEPSSEEAVDSSANHDESSTTEDESDRLNRQIQREVATALLGQLFVVTGGVSAGVVAILQLATGGLGGLRSLPAKTTVTHLAEDGAEIAQTQGRKLPKGAAADLPQEFRAARGTWKWFVEGESIQVGSKAYAPLEAATQIRTEFERQVLKGTPAGGGRSPFAAHTWADVDRFVARELGPPRSADSLQQQEFRRDLIRTLRNDVADWNQRRLSPGTSLTDGTDSVRPLAAKRPSANPPTTLPNGTVDDLVNQLNKIGGGEIETHIRYDSSRRAYDVDIGARRRPWAFVPFLGRRQLKADEVSQIEQALIPYGKGGAVRFEMSLQPNVELAKDASFTLPQAKLQDGGISPAVKGKVEEVAPSTATSQKTDLQEARPARNELSGLWSQKDVVVKVETTRSVSVGKNVLTPDRLKELAGAPDGSVIKVSDDKDLGGLLLRISNPRFFAKDMELILYKDGSKPAVMINQIHMNTSAPSGMGLQIFGRLAKNAQSMGFKEITAYAVREEGKNGYYTWPRFGFNAKLDADVIRALPPSLKGSRTVLDLMKTEEGRQWWRSHGEEIDVVFQLKEDSASWKAFREYMDETNARMQGGSSPHAVTSNKAIAGGGAQINRTYFRADGSLDTSSFSELANEINPTGNRYGNCGSCTAETISALTSPNRRAFRAVGADNRALDWKALGLDHKYRIYEDAEVLARGETTSSILARTLRNGEAGSITRLPDMRPGGVPEDHTVAVVKDLQGRVTLIDAQRGMVTSDPGEINRLFPAPLTYLETRGAP